LRSTPPLRASIDSNSKLEDTKGPGVVGSDDERQSKDTSQGVFWPTTLLPEVLPDTRMFTWGYDADVDRFRSTASQNTIFQHAADLLGDIADLLESEDSDLPIIFVVHSLGGIIVKDVRVFMFSVM
jgi:hypothetical protein